MPCVAHVTVCIVAPESGDMVPVVAAAAARARFIERDRTGRSARQVEICTVADLGGALAECARTTRPTVVVALVAPTLADAARVFAAGGAAVVDVADADMVERGIVATLHDGAFAPPELQAGIVEALHQRREDAVVIDRVARLSAKERAVLDLLRVGADRAEVAAQTGESPYRVRTHVDRAKGKLGVRSQREALGVLSDATDDGSP